MRISRTRVVIAAAVAIVLAQVFQPRRTNPPVDPARTLEARVAVPPDVSAILDRSCRDCHTHETVWPWYAHVVPGSWFVIAHVSDGRRNLNLSDWAQYDAQQADHELDEICEHVEEGEMPLPSYTWLHPDARLTPDDVAVICGWTKSARAALVPVPAGPSPE